MSTRRPQRERSGPAPRLPACPPHLQGEARKEWTRTGRRLLACGLMTEIDSAALAAYCTAWARWVEAEESLRQFGVVLKSPNGYPMPSPFLTIANKAMDQMTRLLAEFGMSPSSRARVSVSPPPAAALPPRDRDERDPRELLRVLP
jgi:P27 family predicted phage terminase small subunit